MEYKGRYWPRVISEKKPKGSIEFSVNDTSVKAAREKAKDFIAFHVKSTLVALVVDKIELLIEGNWTEINI
jgi:hypothetical protein